MIITIAVPASHVSDANDLAMVLGYGPPDEKTYTEPKWQDEDGNLYSAASLTVEFSWILSSTSELSRPEWDTQPYVVNMVAANRAQSIVLFWMPSEEQPEPPKANPNNIVAIVGNNALDDLKLMGLTLIE